MIEQTLSIIKPDAVERNLDNKIKSFFEKKRLPKKILDLGFSNIAESVLGPHPNIVHISGSENRVSVTKSNSSLQRPNLSSREQFLLIPSILCKSQLRTVL